MGGDSVSEDGGRVDESGDDLYGLRALEVLRNLSTAHAGRGGRWQVDHEVAELARAALRKP